MYSLMFLIFLIILCCDVFLVKNPQLKLSSGKDHSQTHSSRGIFQIFRSWIHDINERLNTFHRRNNKDLLQKNILPQNRLITSREIWHSMDSNMTFYFFNNSTLFHKLFHKWLNHQTEKATIKIQFKLNHRHICVDRGRNLSLLIAISTSASHLESRLAIRDTWGGYAREIGAKVLFFVGLPKNNKYHSRINEENAKFRDIIQASFLDTYSNLTLKTISMLKWVSEVCSFVKFVLKVDDDMFINVENILNATRSKNISRAILGELAHEWPPVRSLKNKWYTSYHDYPFNIYPDFVFGPSYLLTGDSIKPLYDASMKMKIFHLEDVYITGLVAEKENIKRINLPAMFNKPRDLQPCNFKKILSSHGHTPPDMRRHWMWLSRRNFQCE